MRKSNLYQRNGIWIFRKEVDGKDIRISTRTRDRRAAERVAVELEARLFDKRRGWDRRVPTVPEWWQTYRATYTPRKRAPHRDEQLIKAALAFFGITPMDAIPKSQCLQFLEKRRHDLSANPSWKRQRPLSEGTIQRERTFLQRFFQTAIEDGHEFPNPWRSIPRVPYAVRDRVLTLEEQQKLLRVLRPRYQRLVLALIGLGVRIAELRGIDPDTDIDWGRRLVRVTGKFGKTREVPLLAEVEPILRVQLEADGCLWRQNPQRLREVLAGACRTAGIPHASPHTLRHTFGHRFLVNGGDIYVLSKILGHSSVAVTEKHYAHLLKEDLVTRTNGLRLGLGVLPALLQPPRAGTKVVTLARWQRQMTQRQEVRKTS